VVVRFDSRRGYGFLAPDDGGEDVFVHQNNISMEGFRFLEVGERVAYELEVGEKGMKAVSVTLLEPRQARPPRSDRDEGYAPRREPRRDDHGGHRDDHGGHRDDHGGQRDDRDDHGGQRDDHGGPRPGRDDRAARKLERLISLLVAKGVLAPGEIDGLDGQTTNDASVSTNGTPG